MKKTLLFLLLSLMLFPAFSQTALLDWEKSNVPRDANKEFQFLAFFINQGVTSNFFPANEFLKGQVVGRLFGRNTSMTSDSLQANYIEQRILPFFIYQPHLFNGKAILRASFEIDWTWGDASYSTGGNQGGAISSDMVNIQTQNVELELIPKDRYYINLGLMRMYDTPYNPYRTLADKMLNTGYRLAYFGTDAVGISVRHDGDFSRWKTGYYKFYENDVQLDDDVNMFEAMFEKQITSKWKVGLSANYVRDRGEGKGGVSILGQGLNSLLAPYNGTFLFNYGNDAYKADVVWLGTFFSRNADYYMDRFHLTGFANYNLGTVRVNRSGSFKKETDIGGLGANLKAAYRYGQTIDDQVKVDLVYTSGDQNALADNKYSGVMTANTWGSPGSIFISSGAYLLFPHGNVVNRFTPAIADISNIGYGLGAGTLVASKGIVPNKLIVKAGAAYAMSMAEPNGGSRYMGIEGNGAVIYNVGPYMSIEGHAAYLSLGDFYKSASQTHGAPVNGGTAGVKPVNPFTAFLVFKWLMF